MHKWKSSFLIAIMMVAAIGQTATEMDSPQINRIASKLKCNCGCGQSMACVMPPGCPVCKMNKAKMVNMQKSGMSDQQILDQFVVENGKDVLVVAQKSGFVYGLDPDKRGEVIWKTQLGKGSGLMGGIAWGIGADARSVYAAVADINRPDGTPGLYAMNIANGEKLWSTPAPKDAGNPAQAAAVTVMPGIAFSASFGGRLRAYDTKDGKIVWEFDAKRDYDTVNGVKAKGGSFDGGGAAISHGMVITSNGYGFAGGMAGNVLLAFSVDGK